MWTGPHPRLATAAALAAALALGCAESGGSLGDVLRRAGVPVQTPLTEGRIAEGLKEALRIGTGNAVAVVGRPDGYLGNPRIRIPMPDGLAALERRLRQVGFGRQVDEFVASMNRAAERAAPEARRIFLDAVAAMTLKDARRILDGPDTAATDYFRGRTQAALDRAFRPIVGRTLDEVGVTRQYRALVARYNQIPLARPQAADLDAHVTGRALNGLFVMLADEERRIRTDPAARVTALLREVFGR